WVNFHGILWKTILSAIPGTFKNAIVASIPILLAALGATFNERSGVINIGLEGIMLISAWGAVYFSFVSGDPFIGILGGTLLGVGLAAIHGIWSIYFKAEQVVTGVAINLFALAITDLLTLLVWGGSSSDSVIKLPIFSFYTLPFGIGDFFKSIQFKQFYFPEDVTLSIYGFHIDLGLLKFIPDIFQIISGQSILVLIAFLLVPICHYVLFHTTFGLRLRVIGEEPLTAATAGIDVRKYQLIAVLISGFLASLGGIYLSIGEFNGFERNMTNGRGFLALAAMIFGKWTIVGSFLASLFFGFFDSLSRTLPFVLNNVPTPIFNIIPYLLAILALAGFVGRARPPKNIGKPYDPHED
ncbi:MAG: ABC transporter permease, partial [Candidatus Thorarchaeota archaeon]